MYRSDFKEDDHHNAHSPSIVRCEKCLHEEIKKRVLSVIEERVSRGAALYELKRKADAVISIANIVGIKNR